MEHTVTFRLKHSTGSPEETDFLSALEELAEIPGVKKLPYSPPSQPEEFPYLWIIDPFRQRRGLSGILQSFAP